jgi:hypothetical protein
MVLKRGQSVGFFLVLYLFLIFGNFSSRDPHYSQEGLKKTRAPSITLQGAPGSKQRQRRSRQHRQHTVLCQGNSLSNIMFFRVIFSIKAESLSHGDSLRVVGSVPALGLTNLDQVSHPRSSTFCIPSASRVLPLPLPAHLLPSLPLVPSLLRP